MVRLLVLALLAVMALTDGAFGAEDGGKKPILTTPAYVVPEAGTYAAVPEASPNDQVVVAAPQGNCCTVSVSTASCSACGPRARARGGRLFSGRVFSGRCRAAVRSACRSCG